VTQAEYRVAAETAARVLRGGDMAPLERAAERRDALAQQLRFEAASELRDRIRDVEALALQQRRLAAYADRNLALLVAPESGSAPRLYLIRRGCLAHASTLTTPIDQAKLSARLREVFGNASAAGMVSRDEVDEMVILDAWLRKHQASVREVPIPPTDPVTALPSLVAAATG
jgi:excinuclease UvrABC nuclease subunit